MKVKRNYLLVLCLAVCISADLGFADNGFEDNEEMINATAAICPYTVLITTGRHACSGSILDKFHILTTARCARNIQLRKKDRLVVLYGDDQNIEVGEVPVREFIVHGDYIQGAWYSPSSKFDIAVFKVEEELPLRNLTSGLQAVNLPTSEAQVDTNAEICGFAKTAVDRNPRKIIRRTLVKNCTTVQMNVNPGHVCTTNPRNVKYCTDYASGDLLIQNGEVIGIDTPPVECKSAIGIYTDVYGHRDWIRSVMNGTMTMMNVPETIVGLAEAL